MQVFAFWVLLPCPWNACTMLTSILNMWTNTDIPPKHSDKFNALEIYLCRKDPTWSWYLMVKIAWITYINLNIWERQVWSILHTQNRIGISDALHKISQNQRTGCKGTHPPHAFHALLQPSPMIQIATQPRSTVCLHNSTKMANRGAQTDVFGFLVCIQKMLLTCHYYSK